MQAPTTPSGPPVQDPGERACPGCGAANAALAAFCWQCYRQFGPAGSAAPPGARYPGAAYVPSAGGLRGAVTAPIPTTSFPERTGRGLGATAGLVIVAIAVAAGVYLFLNRGPSAELPNSFGGLTQIQDPQVDAVLDVVRDQAGAEGIEADMGIYGTAGIPSAALVWVTNADAPSTDAAFVEFAGGFNSGLGTGSLDETRKTTEVVDGITFVCAPVVGTPTANICLWEAEDVWWMLFDLSGSNMNATQALAASASSAIA